MSAITREALAAISDLAMDLDINMDIREDYSGRGMFGEKCVGFVVPTMRDCWQLAMLLGTAAGDGITTNDWGDPVTDDMGRGIIIYFPRIQVEKEENRGA